MNYQLIVLLSCTILLCGHKLHNEPAALLEAVFFFSQVLQSVYSPYRKANSIRKTLQSVKSIRITWQLSTAKNNKSITLYTVYSDIKKNVPIYILYGTTLKLSTKNTTELHHRLWVYGCWALRHSALNVWNGKKVQSQKCWSNKLDKKGVSAVADDSTRIGGPLENGRLIRKTLRNAACIQSRAYQMSFQQLGRATDVYGSHFYRIWVLFKNIPDK